MLFDRRAELKIACVQCRRPSSLLYDEIATVVTSLNIRNDRPPGKLTTFSASTHNLQAPDLKGDVIW